MQYKDKLPTVNNVVIQKTAYNIMYKRHLLVIVAAIGVHIFIKKFKNIDGSVKKFIAFSKFSFEVCLETTNIGCCPYPFP